MSLGRRRLGLTQEQFAERVGIATGTLRNYEAGHRLPDLRVAARIAGALALSLDDMARTVAPVRPAVPQPIKAAPVAYLATATTGANTQE